jgi:hypothetical protein
MKLIRLECMPSPPESTMPSKDGIGSTTRKVITGFRYLIACNQVREWGPFRSTPTL